MKSDKNLLKIVSWSLQLAILISFPLAIFCASLDEAQESYLYGDYEKAINEAGQLETGEALYFLGASHIKIADYAKARVYLRKLLKEFPDGAFYEPGLIKLSDTYFLEGNFARAKALYEEISQRPAAKNYLPLVYLRLAQIASKEGNWQEKGRYLKMIKEKFPRSCEMKFVEILSNLGNFFTIQTGAFSDKKNAVSLKEELSGKNYPVYIVKEKSDNLALYKIRVGEFKERSEAENVYSKLLSEGYSARIYP